jgi:hypothetical protein
MLNCESNSIRDPALQEELHRLGTDKESDLVWCSGDYESATDNFKIECGSIILREALKNIDHLPTIEWALKELSAHHISYPKKYQIESGIQKNGQLMGSLLSFPLLCLVNDSTARLAGAKPKEYLINGDDIVMRVKTPIAQKWMEIAPKLGLTLSMGKTFFDPDFGTVNSQLFWRGELLQTGKQKVTSRRCEIIGECFRDFQRYYQTDENQKVIRSLFLSLNRPALKQTHESLDIPVSHGGLGLVTQFRKSVPKERASNYLVYFTKILRKLRYQKGKIKLPYFGSSWENIPKKNVSVYLEPRDVKNGERGVNSQEIHETKSLIEKNKNLKQSYRQYIDGDTELENFPDLSFIQIRTLDSNNSTREMQLSITNRFLNLFTKNSMSYFEVQAMINDLRSKSKNREIESLGLVSEEKTKTLSNCVGFDWFFDQSSSITVPEKLWSNCLSFKKLEDYSGNSKEIREAVRICENITLEEDFLDFSMSRHELHNQGYNYTFDVFCTESVDKFEAGESTRVDFLQTRSEWQ